MSPCCLFGSSDEEQIQSQKHVMVIQPFYELEISRIAVLFLRTEGVLTEELCFYVVCIKLL